MPTARDSIQEPGAAKTEQRGRGISSSRRAPEKHWTQDRQQNWGWEEKRSDDTVIQKQKQRAAHGTGQVGWAVKKNGTLNLAAQ
jgi:hypothetical protein